MKNAVIVVLLLFCGYLADRLVRAENQRYALSIGMCAEGPMQAAGLPDLKCLSTVQTRTSWVWHLWYGLTDPLPAVPWGAV